MTHFQEQTQVLGRQSSIFADDLCHSVEVLGTDIPKRFDVVDVRADDLFIVGCERLTVEDSIAEMGAGEERNTYRDTNLLQCLDRSSRSCLDRLGSLFLDDFGFHLGGFERSTGGEVFD